MRMRFVTISSLLAIMLQPAPAQLTANSGEKPSDGLASCKSIVVAYAADTNSLLVDKQRYAAVARRVGIPNDQDVLGNVYRIEVRQTLKGPRPGKELFVLFKTSASPHSEQVTLAPDQLQILGLETVPPLPSELQVLNLSNGQLKDVSPASVRAICSQHRLTTVVTSLSDPQIAIARKQLKKSKSQ